MGEIGDRRARKKAETRTKIRTIAHAMFAEHGFEAVTIADIAREADVAVQTVFNHFATKEELFFEARADWVGAAARAVRQRPTDVPALSALRAHLLQSVRDYLAAVGTPEHDSVITTLEASPALSAYEGELHHESVRQLSAALAENADRMAPVDHAGIAPEVMASLTASVWMAAIRALLIEHRGRLVGITVDSGLRAQIERFTERVLTGFEDMAPDRAELPAVTGWPTGIRRAG